MRYNRFIDGTSADEGLNEVVPFPSPETARALSKITGDDARNMLRDCPGRDYSLAMGVDADGRPVYWDYVMHPLLDVLGPSGSGKSTLVRNIIRQLGKQRGCLVVAFSKMREEVEWVEDIHLANTSIVDDSTAAIGRIRLELAARMSSSVAGVDVIRNLPRVFLILDEPGFETVESGVLGDIARNGSEMGIHIVLVQHGPRSSGRSPYAISPMYEADIIGVDSRIMDTAVFGRYRVDAPARTGDGTESYSSFALSGSRDAVLYHASSSDDAPRPFVTPTYSGRALAREMAPYCWRVPEAFESARG